MSERMLVGAWAYKDVVILKKSAEIFLCGSANFAVK